MDASVPARWIKLNVLLVLTIAAVLIPGGAGSSVVASANREDGARQSARALREPYFPPPDSEGGWRSVREPDDVRRVGGMDRGRLDEAFEFIKGSSRNGGLPHYPYSLQFSVNADGEVPELPRDAFWKAGSGGHALYIVPSLDLVAWKLGGRDDQYSPTNTGMTPDPEAVTSADRREGWTQSVDNETALRRTLQLVVAAVRE